MMWLGEQLLGYGKVLSPGEIKRRLSEVTPAAVRAVARNFFGAEKVSGNGAYGRRRDFGQAAFDLPGRKDLAVTKKLFAQPHHLVFRAFQAEVQLAEDLIACAAELRGRR